MAVTQSKRPREMLSPAQFALESCLTWTPWQLGIAMEPPKRGYGNWTARPSLSADSIGYHNRKLFRGTNHRGSAIYEVAVQSKCRNNKKYVVYFHVMLNGCLDRPWDSTLFRKNPRLVRQVDDVLKQGCKVYVRRAVLPARNITCNLSGRNIVIPNLDGLRTFLEATYDYAWKQRYSGTGRQQRLIVRSGCTLSNDNL